MGDNRRMRIAIFGAGGVGAYFGARLAAAGAELAVIARGAHLDAIRANGMRVDSVLGDMHVEPAIASASTADAVAVTTEAVFTGPLQANVDAMTPTNTTATTTGTQPGSSSLAMV